MEGINLGLIFLTGLTTGGLTCVAVQGGLLASVLANKEEKAIENKIVKSDKTLEILSFLIAKVIAYTLLGFALGWAGSLFDLTPNLRGILQIAIGIYLIGVAGAIGGVHPFFRYFIFKPPKFLARLVKKQTGSESWLAPAMLGAMTVFLPCATTQAMEVIALGTGSPVAGALIMMAFTIGASPTFFLIGFIFSKASASFKGWFDKVSVALLIVLAVVSVNSGVALMGSIYTLQNFAKVALSPVSSQAQGAEKSAEIIDGVQYATINVYSGGYSSESVVLKKNVKTVLKLKTNNTAGCSRAFTIPSLGIQKILPETGEETIEFTPTKSGPLTYSCSMGMYSGLFKVI